MEKFDRFFSCVYTKFMRKLFSYSSLGFAATFLFPLAAYAHHTKEHAMVQMTTSAISLGILIAGIILVTLWNKAGDR